MPFFSVSRGSIPPNNGGSAQPCLVGRADPCITQKEE